MTATPPSDGREPNRPSAVGDRLHSPSANRNKSFIAAEFGRLAPAPSAVLEVGAGTGEHAITLAAPGMMWWPTDPDDSSRRSIASWIEDRPDVAFRTPIGLDVAMGGWWQAMAEAGFAPDTVLSINMIHIAPPTATDGLFEGAAALLPVGGRLVLYGPFSRRGVMVESNEAFHQSLRSRDPSWGVRDLDDRLQPLGARFGLVLAEVREMPANNLFVVFEKG